MTRDAIKYIAAITMLLNHSAQALSPSGGSMAASLMIGIGYFTAVTMCYFLAEGFCYTHSRALYKRRMLVFACVSQLPYHVALSKGGFWHFVGFNMLFSLFLCLQLLELLETMPDGTQKKYRIAGIFFLSLFCDWPLMAPYFVLLFYQTPREQLKEAYRNIIFLFVIVNFFGTITTIPIWNVLVETIVGAVAICISGWCIVKWYNGQKYRRAARFHKCFFYVFYPLHLSILCLIKYGPWR